MLDKNFIYLNSKNRTKSLSLFLLINKYFWKSIIGPVFAIAIPLIFMLIFYGLSFSKDRPYTYINSFGGIISFTVFPLCFFALSSTNLEFKKSIILRKLKNENFSKSKYISILIGYYLMIIFGFCLINTVIFYLFCLNPTRFEPSTINGLTKSTTFKDSISNINIGSLLFSFLLLIIQTISFSLLISVVCNNPITVQFAGFGMMMLTLILSGQILPIVQWVQISFFKYLTLINPIGYPINLINISTIVTPSAGMNNIFDFITNTEVIYKEVATINTKYIVYFGWEKPLFIFVPIALSSIFIFLNIKLFKWTNR
ncbi:MAG: ABC transporter permease [Ureaplasma sp.]|nr:ABC transporter permease [Ureaplasma sp.]